MWPCTTPKGHEPHFTNLAQTRYDTGGPFSATLDYIFLSEQLRVAGASAPPTRGSVFGAAAEHEGVSLPSALEPSDHVLIHADLQF